MGTGLTKKGSALLILVLLLGTLGFTVFLAFARTRLDTIPISAGEQDSVLARAHALGCLDEALAWLQIDDTFAPVNVDIGTVVCTLSITTPQEGERNVNVSASEGEAYYGLQAHVILDPFAVDSLSEGL